MTVSRLALFAAGSAAFALAACSKPATTTTTAQSTPPAAPVAPGTAGAAAPLSPLPATIATDPAAPAQATAVAAAPVNGYSCSFPGPGGQSILARFTLDGGGAHDDQGLPFTVLTNSPTALVMAHARDDLATTPSGDVGAYVVAIDRRTLGMVQTTMGLNGPGSTRRGHCIAG